MVGSAHWLSVLFVIIPCAAVAALWVLDRVAERRYAVERHHLFCPRKHLDVDCDVVRPRDSLVLLGVRRCTAFLDPETVPCSKDCIRFRWGTLRPPVSA